VVTLFGYCLSLEGFMETILKQHKELLAQVDDWFSRCVNLYPEKISCKSGCSACCRSTFDITLLDAYYLKLGFDAVPDAVKEKVLKKCRERLGEMREHWPELDHPYILNYRPEEDWELLMPEEDETPCVLLGDDGRCLVYDNRPMTCRLHGIPFIDTTGEEMHDDWCTMNFMGEDPLQLTGLRAPFDEMFRREVALFRDFTGEMFQKRMSELDTLIPTALLTDFGGFDWKNWLGGFTPFAEGSD
jgi:Fe-S-cluster containining protein